MVKMKGITISTLILFLAFVSQTEGNNQKEAAIVVEPSYQGRSLSSWLKDLQSTPGNPYKYGPAAYAIRQMGKAALPDLLKIIEKGESNANLAVNAIRELGPLAQPAIPKFQQLLQMESSSIYAAMSLVYLQSEKSVIETLSNSDPLIRHNAILALGYGGTRVDATAVDPIIKQLKEVDPSERYTVIWALGQIGKEGEKVIPVLNELLRDENEWTRKTSAESLGNFPSTQSIPPLLRALSDSKASVRAAACYSLGMVSDRINDEDLVKNMIISLIKSLKDTDDSVRNNAAWALGAIGPRAKDAVPALSELANNQSDNAHQTASASIKHINDRTR